MVAKKFYVDLDLLQNELLNGRIHNVTEAPASPLAGQMWFNTVDSTLNYFDGEEVRTIAQGSDLTNAVLRATQAAAAGELLISGGADRSVESYDPELGEDESALLKVSATGVVSNAVAGTDYLAEVTADDFAEGLLATDMSTLNAEATQIPTADAVKAYIDTQVASLSKLVGPLDASAGALPTAGSGLEGDIVSGDYWRVSVAGIIQGIGPLEVGDVVVASVDEASSGQDFFALQANLTDVVTSSSTTSEEGELVVFNSTTGKIVEGSGVNVSVLTGITHKYAATFNDSTDWVGEAAPYTFTVAAETHLIASDNKISVTVFDSTGEDVGVGISRGATGDVVISANEKFAGSVVLIA